MASERLLDTENMQSPSADQENLASLSPTDVEKSSDNEEIFGSPDENDMDKPQLAVGDIHEQNRTVPYEENLNSVNPLDERDGDLLGNNERLLSSDGQENQNFLENSTGMDRSDDFALYVDNTGGNDTKNPLTSIDLAKDPPGEGILEEDDIDAPVPSPFSDIGDISGAENAMISDILKETSHEHHISPAFQEFSESLEGIDATSPRHVVDEQKEVNADNFDDDPDDNVAMGSNDDKDGHKSLPSDQDISFEQGATKNKNTEGNEHGGGDVGGLIADIFGDSDDEEEEFEGFHEDELQKERKKLKSRASILDDEDSSEADNGNELLHEQQSELEANDTEGAQENRKASERDQESSSDDEQIMDKQEVISDFDLMMQRKKEAMGNRRRRKRDFEIINDNDDIIAAMIRNMRDAAEEDRMLNQAGRAATKKLKMLDSVVSHLHKADLQHTFIDGGVLPVMKEWLSPLPDNSLPHMMIRKQFLKLLSEFPSLDTGALKMSGIGRAVMLLYKHPRESKENRHIAGKIVASWARPIFGVQTNFRDISKEEREERDKCNAAEQKRRRLSSTDDALRSSADDDKSRPRRPGDKGFVARARVPRPSNRDYIVRPRSDVSIAEIGGMKNPKKSLDRFEKQMRKYKERKGLKTTAPRAVSMSLNGSKMSL